MTTKDFIIKSQNLFGDKYDYKKTHYVNKSTKVTIACPIHGDWEQSPESHYKSTGCPKCAREDKHKDTVAKCAEEFIDKAKMVHGNKYNYSKTIYKSAREKVTIICPEHGEFTQRVHAHLAGQNCPGCGRIGMLQGRENLRKSTETFITEAKQIHGNKYDYSITEYFTAKTDLAIMCPTHGVFEQRPSNHLRGLGCPKCASKGWSDTEWEHLGSESKYFESFKLYIIECWSDNERFIKIGKTFKTIGERFSKRLDMPYQWKVLLVRQSSAKYISELERSLQKQAWEYKYKPKLPFSGQTECFTIEANKIIPTSS